MPHSLQNITKIKEQFLFILLLLGITAKWFIMLSYIDTIFANWRLFAMFISYQLHWCLHW